MSSQVRRFPAIPAQARIALLASAALLAGCHAKENAGNEAAEAPPAPSSVTSTGGTTAVHVDRPVQFPLVAAAPRPSFSTLSVTGQVQPDVSREVPVLSLANGRVTALHVGLGDYVKKGQLVMDVQSADVTGAFDTYVKAVNDERLTNTTLTRDKLLFDKGAIAKSQLEVAQDGEDDAQADLKAAEQQLKILGVDKNHPGDSVHVYAPITGIVVAQNTTAAGAAGLNVAGTGGSLTIADLSHIWVVCDVYENDLAQVHLGETAEIRLNAYPDKPARTGTISDIGAVLDPNLRTAKVRIQVLNPDNLLRVGMFATASFHSRKAETTLVIPATAILHLHDRDFVFVPSGTSGNYRRVAVVTSTTLPGNVVEVKSGLSEGQQVVSNALELEDATQQ